MEPEIILLNEVTQTQQDKCHMFFLMGKLALNLYICVFKLEYPVGGNKLVRGYGYFNEITEHRFYEGEKENSEIGKVKRGRELEVIIEEKVLGAGQLRLKTFEPTIIDAS